MKKFTAFFILIISVFPALAQESMSYISYYPTPFASYTTITANEVTVSNPATGGGLITATLGTVKIGEANVGKDLNVSASIDTNSVTVGSGAMGTGTLYAKKLNTSDPDAVLRLNQTLGSGVTTGGELHLIDGLMMSESGSTNKQLFPTPQTAANKSLAKISPGMIWKLITYPDPNNTALTKTAKFLVINDGGSTSASVCNPPAAPPANIGTVNPTQCSTGDTCAGGTGWTTAVGVLSCCPNGWYWTTTCSKCMSGKYFKTDGSTGGCCTNSTDTWNGSACVAQCSGWNPASAPDVCCPTGTNYYYNGCKSCPTSNNGNIPATPNAAIPNATGCVCSPGQAAGNYGNGTGYPGTPRFWNPSTGFCVCASDEVGGNSYCCPASLPFRTFYYTMSTGYIYRCCPSTNYTVDATAYECVAN